MEVIRFIIISIIKHSLNLIRLNKLKKRNGKLEIIY